LRGEHGVDNSVTVTGSRSSLADGEKAIQHAAADFEKGGDGHFTEEEDENIVWWDGDDDPAKPMNWKSAKKWYHVAIVSATTFLTYVCPSTGQLNVC
jgi:hypothetical protein